MNQKDIIKYGGKNEKQKRKPLVDSCETMSSIKREQRKVFERSFESSKTYLQKEIV